jgi:hypothetical protein
MVRRDSTALTAAASGRIIQQRLLGLEVHMSFYVSIVGKPDALKRQLAKEAETLSGQSREEFDAVRPALEAIIDQNVSDPSVAGPSVLRVQANGHATFINGVKTSGQCTVHVESIGPLAE